MKLLWKAFENDTDRDLNNRATSYLNPEDEIIEPTDWVKFILDNLFTILSVSGAGAAVSGAVVIYGPGAIHGVIQYLVVGGRELAGQSVGQLATFALSTMRKIHDSAHNYSWGNITFNHPASQAVRTIVINGTPEAINSLRLGLDGARTSLVGGRIRTAYDNLVVEEGKIRELLDAANAIITQDLAKMWTSKKNDYKIEKNTLERELKRLRKLSDSRIEKQFIDLEAALIEGRAVRDNLNERTPLNFCDIENIYKAFPEVPTINPNSWLEQNGGTNIQDGGTNIQYGGTKEEIDIYNFINEAITSFKILETNTFIAELDDVKVNNELISILNKTLKSTMFFIQILIFNSTKNLTDFTKRNEIFDSEIVKELLHIISCVLMNIIDKIIYLVSKTKTDLDGNFKIIEDSLNTTIHKSIFMHLYDIIQNNNILFDDVKRIPLDIDKYYEFQAWLKNFEKNINITQQTINELYITQLFDEATKSCDLYNKSITKPSIEENEEEFKLPKTTSKLQNPQTNLPVLVSNPYNLLGKLENEEEQKVELRRLMEEKRKKKEKNE